MPNFCLLFMTVGVEIVRGFSEVSCTVMGPKTFEIYLLALGLALPESHDEGDSAAAAIKVLDRYGMEKSDLKFSVSETSDSAAAAGRQTGLLA